MYTLKTFTAVMAMMLISVFTSLENGYKVGDIATDFKLENVDGNMVSLS
ncbi:MAG TPA: thioredoxin family protein, partial [Xanthomarina gelatinilytica]|nr:thioredoxin family protein [Xanthomarina gelatinilytica]